MAAHAKDFKYMLSSLLLLYKLSQKNLRTTERSTVNDPSGSQTTNADARRLRNRISARKEPDLFFRSLTRFCQPGLTPHSKRLQRRESYQTIRSYPRNCSDPAATTVHSPHSIRQLLLEAILRTTPCCSGLVRSNYIPIIS